MIAMTPRQRSDEIVFMRAQVELIENIEIENLRDGQIRCIRDGRLASAGSYGHLINALRNDVEAYRRCIDQHLTAIARGE